MFHCHYHFFSWWMLGLRTDKHVLHLSPCQTALHWKAILGGLLWMFLGTSRYPVLWKKKPKPAMFLIVFALKTAWNSTSWTAGSCESKGPKVKAFCFKHSLDWCFQAIPKGPQNPPGVFGIGGRSSQTGLKPKHVYSTRHQWGSLLPLVVLLKLLKNQVRRYPLVN